MLEQQMFQRDSTKILMLNPLTYVHIIYYRITEKNVD
jgi:hypothetical protein